MKITSLSRILLLAVAAALVVACGGSSTAVAPGQLRGANVLVVTLDTTRADRLGCYGHEGAATPVLDELADHGVLFEQAITPTAFTLPSHSSIFTGMYPPYHGVRLNGGAALADVHTTMAERLASDGYRTGGFIGAFVLDGRWGLEQGFEHYDDDFQLGADQRLDLSRVQRSADEVVDAALGWLDQGDGRPFFAWVHLYDPHTPYDPPEPYHSRFAAGGESTLYDGEIAFTDSQVGRLLQWLDDQDLADNTIVVVVGDHGEGLGSHGEDEHGYYIYDYAVHVPLLMKLPGVAGVRVPAQVRTIDVMPTVTDLLGIEDTSAIHGLSMLPLLNEPDGEGPGVAYSESMAINLQYGWSALYSLRTTEFKYIDAPRAELYALADDRDEKDNVLAAHGELVVGMCAQLASLRERIEEGAPETEEADFDEDTLQMLASLGYVAGETVSASDGETLADPKDKIHLYESLGYAAHLMGEDEYTEAVEVLEIVLDADPEIPQARLLLASAYRKVDRNGEAKQVLDDFLKANPDSVRALITMAGILSEEGDTDEVLAICRRALSFDDRNTQAYELMAGVYMQADDHQGSLPLLERVVEIQPKLTRNRINLAASMVGLDRLGEAETILEEIVEEYPKFPLAHFHLGLLREEQGRTAEAVVAYEREVELYPHSVAPRFNLGNLLLRTGDGDGAAEQMRLLIDLAPEMPRAYLTLARVELARGEDLPEVERLAKAGLERAESAELKALGYFLLADTYSRQGRRAELEAAVEKGQYYRARLGG